MGAPESGSPEEFLSLGSRVSCAWPPRCLKSQGVPGLANTLLAMLNAEDRAILDFERACWFEPGPKDMAIEMSLGLSAAAYYERLRSLVLDPGAFAYDPLTTKRVRMLIEEKRPTGLAV